MFILFDSNVWIEQLGLQSKSGAAIRHFARRRSATVVIPEVVRLEIEEKLTSDLIKIRDTMESGHKRLLTVFGKLRPISLPSEDDIREIVAGIVPSIDVPVREISFDLDVARSSLTKILRKTPPSSKNNEQFRDGVIWAHCLDLLYEDDVYLVTKDTHFYQQRDYKNGMAYELVEEMKQLSKNHRVILVSSMDDLLDEISMPITLSGAQVLALFGAEEHETIDEILVSNGFELCGDVKGDTKCFATENADRVYFTFTLTHPCKDSTDAGRRPGELRIEGYGFLDPETAITDEIGLSRVYLFYPDWEPSGIARGVVNVSAHSGGPKIHRVRFPLDPMEEVAGEEGDDN